MSWQPIETAVRLLECGPENATDLARDQLDHQVLALLTEALHNATPKFAESAFAFEHIRGQFEETLGILVGVCECGHSTKDHGITPTNANQMVRQPCANENCACRQFEDVQVFERLGWDQYDNSLEIYDCPPAFRLTAEAAAFIWQHGFTACYVNHTDGWNTFYYPKTDLTRPWRRKARDGGFDVNYFPESWPKESLENGYIKVVPDEPTP